MQTRNPFIYLSFPALQLAPTPAKLLLALLPLHDGPNAALTLCTVQCTPSSSDGVRMPWRLCPAQSTRA